MANLIEDHESCPSCGSVDIHREEVDIGVGTQRGPLHCNRCGFDEQDEADRLLARPLDEFLEDPFGDGK